ncbi:MAG: GGDEF domain-containing protein [Gammaproteobacteria bacterium]|nr:GGDEF domain-containing protein [Gammaproteobacteria bacterium]
MSYLKRVFIETGEVWAKRQLMAQISIALGFVFIACVQLWSKVASDILSLPVLFAFTIAIVGTHVLVKQYSWPGLYSVLANAVLSYVCLAIYLSDVDVRIQTLIIPLLPLLFYFLNPLWLFNTLSGLFLAMLVAVREIDLLSKVSQFEYIGLVLLAYSVVWAALLIEGIVHRRDRARLKSYMSYDEESEVFNPKALLRVLETSVANTQRYQHKMSLVMFEFYSASDRHKAVITPGSKLERALLACVSANIRRGDTLAKWKDNSFVIIVPESDQQGSEKLLAKLGQIICHMRLPGLDSLDMRYGIAALQHESHIELLALAQQALDSSKRQSVAAHI